MSDLYLEALQNYLNGSEWRSSIDDFIRTYCQYFVQINNNNHHEDIVHTVGKGSKETYESSHEQYTLFKSFQNIVEEVLDNALANIGGNLDLLEQAIDDFRSMPSRGPKNDITKDVLEKLDCVSDFDSFTMMMNQAYREMLIEQASYDRNCESSPRNYESSPRNYESSPRNYESIDSKFESNERTKQSLLQMGFNRNQIDRVLSNNTESKDGGSMMSMEELLMILTLEVDEPEGYRDDVADVKDNSSTVNHSRISPAMIKFIREAHSVGVIIDANEFHAKFVIADSVLDTCELGFAGPQATAMMSLIRWAEDMKIFLHDIDTAYEQRIDSSSVCYNFSGGLIEWYVLLEKQRQDIESKSIAGSVLSDAELHRMMELDKIAAMGTADEQLLHSLLSRHDEVSKEVDTFHRQCGLLIAADKSISRFDLEELYLYLKQQVANGLNLDTIVDELHEHVYNKVPSSKAPIVISLLLDMHIAEDEEALLRQKIHALVGASQDDRHLISDGNNGNDDRNGGSRFVGISSSRYNSDSERMTMVATYIHYRSIQCR